MTMADDNGDDDGDDGGDDGGDDDDYDDDDLFHNKKQIKETKRQ